MSGSKISTVNWVISIIITLTIVVIKILLYYNFILNNDPGDINIIATSIVTIVLGEMIYGLLLCLCLDEFEEEPYFITLPFTSLMFIILGLFILIIHKLFKRDNFRGGRNTIE